MVQTISALQIINGTLSTAYIFKGYVTAIGAGDILPVGWVVSKLGNRYDIIHNLGLINLSDLSGSFTPLQPPTNHTRLQVVQATLNRVRVRCYDNAGAQNTAFTFTAFKF